MSRLPTWLAALAVLLVIGQAWAQEAEHGDLPTTARRRTQNVDCVTQETFKCTRRCRRSGNKATRISETCKLQEVTVSSRNACNELCMEDESCRHVEIWSMTGRRKFNCALFACADPSAEQWRKVWRLRRHYTNSISCEKDEGCDLGSGGALSSKEWGFDISSLSRAGSRVLQDLGPEENLGLDETHSLAGSRPNIILLFVDDLGIGDTGVEQFNGNTPRYNSISTPNLQRLANDGVAYRNAYSPNSVCLPSRHSMLIGRHSGHTTIRGNSGIYDDLPFLRSEVPVAEALQKKGYATAVIGKWGMGNHRQDSHPLQRGFDYFYGQLTHLDAHACFPNKVHDNSITSTSIFKRYEQNADLERNKFASEELCGQLNAPYFDPRDTQCDFVQDVFTNRGIKYIEDHLNANPPTKEDPKGKPFFLYMAWTVPHVCSWSRRPTDRQRKVAPFWDRKCPFKLVRASNKFGEERGITEEECKHKSIMENYIDRDVGRFRDLVDGDDRLRENTIIIFAGDNGPERNEADQNLVVNRQNGYKVIHSVDTFNSTNGMRGIKRLVYEGSLRTPLIAYWNGVTPKGAKTTSEVQTALYDWYTTFLHLAGYTTADVDPDASRWLKTRLGLRQRLDGISLVPSLMGDDLGQVRHTYLYFEYCHRQSANWKSINSDPGSWCSYALLIRHWKLVYNYLSQKTQLFDLQNDPLESKSIFVNDASDTSPKSISLRRQQATMKCIRSESAFTPLKEVGFSP